MVRSGWPPARSRSGFVLPLLLIVVGGVLFLNNLGVVSWSIWATLTQFWPAILILLGVELVLGRRTPALGVIAVLVVLGIAVLSATHHPLGALNSARVSVNKQVTSQSNIQSSSQSNSQVAGPMAEQAVPLGDVKSARINLNVGAGNLSVGALPSGDADLVKADAAPPDGIQLNQTNSSQNGETELALVTGRSGFFLPFANHNQPGNGMNVSVAQKVPLVLQTDVGAGQSDLDLRDLAIQSLDVKSGAGQVTVQFPNGSGQSRANIRSGAGNVTLVIPPHVGAYLHTTDGLVSVQLPPGQYTQVADGYQSDNYAKATDRIDIYLHMGVGQVDVQ